MDNIKSGPDLKELTTRIVSAYVGANQVAAHMLPDLIAAIYSSLAGLGNGAPKVSNEKAKPAISVAKSISDDYIICLEDGKRLKMLKRYLRSNFSMSPEEYRKKWNLPPDYPMVAPNYAKRRSEFAKQIGLGRGVRGKV